MPQNPLWPESNLNNFVLPTFSPSSKLWWAYSHDQMRPLHQVVHQGELICMTKSWQSHFCWFLGFTKVTLATSPKWDQTWWNTLFLLSILKFEQLYIAKHVQMFSSLVNMLKWLNNSSRPNGTSWRKCYIDQSAPKPSLSRTKFEQLYIGNFLLLISTFVDMFRTSNDDTTLSAASRRIDLRD